VTRTGQEREMEERAGPSRPFRLGTRRRRAKRAASEPGAPCLSGAKAHSLDTGKQLATSVQEWSDSQKTEKDYRAEQISLKSTLAGSIHFLWQRYAREGNAPEAAKWEKQWFQVSNCQTEWVGYRAACCGEQTRPIAVPIGCNHRMCPLCAWHRSQLARVRIKTMFDRLTHPVLITLTIPNRKTIKKHDFTLFRQRVRQFIAQHKEWIHGGVYSLETTYNRREKSWHIHCHILADVSTSLPAKTEKTELAGQRCYAFTAIKLKLEFDWLRLWSTRWGKMARKGASAMRLNGDIYEFEQWVCLGRAMRLKEWSGGAYRTIEGLSTSELRVRSEWNAANRRIVDLRPVTDRDGAAREVLKYITKAADFCDIPAAVEEFCNAVRGARLIQTFGSWYGVKLDTVFDPNHLEDWGEMKCTCGLNCWERMGVFYARDVETDETGRSFLKRSFDHRSRGTVPRPTIRALEAPVEEGEQLCKMERR